MATDHANDTLLKPFRDPAFVARYVEGPPRFVPGFADLHRMTDLLLAERAPEDARLLVLGAGGGLELKALAQAHPLWRFAGVDPAPEMLKLAKDMLGPLASRVTLVEGYIDDAPEGPFDGAVCLLTLHFLDATARRHAEEQIHRRLRLGAPFVVTHASFPQGAGRENWLARYARFALGSGADPAQVEKMRTDVGNALSLYDPAEDEALLRAAGFRDVQLFYAAFTWRGWICHA